MLYLVATPIGNLEDITYRALKVLESADIIACEDTRNTQKLLNYFEINNKKLISYHEHNEEKVSEKIIEHLKEGLTIALVSDAGMPCISDPGYVLVNKCKVEGIIVQALPGANAGLTALVASGIESYSYTFYGFLPRKTKDLSLKLQNIMDYNSTAILYESPHRVQKLIEEIVKISANRVICVARELTKLYEQIETSTAEEILSKFTDGSIKNKGEFVVIIAPNKEQKTLELTNDELVEEVENLVEEGYKNSEAIKVVAKKYNINKREVYNLYHEKHL